MKQMLRFLFLILITVIIVSCKDNDEGSIVSTDPIDSYVGEHKSFQLKQETKDFHHDKFLCVMLAPDGTEITREGEHVRLNQISYFNLEKGLKSGVYRLLSFKTEIEDSRTGDVKYEEYGLGCRIEIAQSGETTTLDSYNAELGLSGEGTEESPYIVNSYDHLKKLRNFINDNDNNKLIKNDTRFKQYLDIDMNYASFTSDATYGWLPIGSSLSNPFRGQYDGGGYTISNLWSKRSDSSGIGLFGFVEGAVLSNIVMKTPQIEGGYATGAIAGGIISPGDRKLASVIRGCRSVDGSVTGAEKIGIGTGGLLGAVDMKSCVLIDSCSNQNTIVKGAYGVGGLLGVAALRSTTVVSNSNNNAQVESTNSGTGGLVGSVDTLIVVACKNRGDITGSKNKTNSDTEGCYATGGLVGGAGYANISSCENSGNVTGYVGVGGIIGSSRVGSEMLMFNSVSIRTASNEGAITGNDCVGGICGEAQFAGYALYNSGAVKATASENSHVGGVVGNTSLTVIYNAINTGDISTECTSGGTIGGIVSKSNWASLLTCQNFGKINGAPQHMGGVIALAGNNTVINYCSNSGAITTNSSNNCIGGIAGALGDQREWSAENISACIFGAIDIALGFFGPLFAVIEGFELIGEGVGHVIHLTELGIGYISIYGEKVLLGIGIHEMLNPEIVDEIEANMTDVSQAIDSQIRENMDNVRRSESSYIAPISAGLQSNSLSSFTDNLILLNQFNESSDENNELINYNMNMKREERMEELEESKRTQEIVQKSISAACIVFIGAASVVSAFATAGTTLAISATVFISASSIVGGTNAIVEGVTDYPENAVIVSQCANYGDINANNKKDSGGVIGIANQNCWIKDCLNVSTYNGPSDNDLNGLIGTKKNAVNVDRCLIIGSNWGYNSTYGYSSVLYNPQYEGTSNSLSLDDLHKVTTYTAKDWDISSMSDQNMKTKWVVKDESGHYPVPQRSEMVDEEEEHD